MTLKKKDVYYNLAEAVYHDELEKFHMPSAEGFFVDSLVRERIAAREKRKPNE